MLLSAHLHATLSSLLLALAWCACAQAQTTTPTGSAQPEGASTIAQNPGWHFQKQAVAAANPLATEAGYAMLAAGGSAVDAAIAVQMVLSLVEPQSSGIGGGAFLVHFDGKAVQAYDGRETAPAQAGPDLFLGADGKPMPMKQAIVGGRAVGVPGALRMLAMAHAAHGKLPWAFLFAPAIRLARDGFAVSPRLAALLAGETALQKDPVAAQYFYDAQGHPWPAGHLLRNPELAAVLQRIATEGPDALMTGEVAQAMVNAVRQHPSNPGLLQLSDLAAYRPLLRQPLCTRYAVAPYWTEAGGSGFGALRLHLVFPPNPSRPSEPLVVSGANTPTADYIFANYPSGGRVTFGFLHAGAETVQSSGFRTEGDRIHQLDVSLPSFFPSEQSPFFATRSLDEIAALKRDRVTVKLDGRSVLNAAVHTYAATPEQVTIGSDRLGQSFGAAFTGRIVAVERSSLRPPPGLAENAGPLELTLVLPERLAPEGETLLATGQADKMDALVLVPDGARVRLIAKFVDGSTVTGESFALDAAVHVLAVTWGGLEVSRPDAARPFKASLDGKTVLEGNGRFAFASPQAVNLGENFTGRLKSVRRLP